MLRTYYCFLALLILFVSACAHAKETTRPNIVLLFADDAGYGDFGFHGSQTFPTPHLDKLASQGVLFKQAYVSAAVCGPSRAGMLTGLYQQRFGFEENNVPGYMSPSGLVGDEMGLPTELRTIADYLKPLGYTSAIVGKWHLGNADRFHPLERGFDEFYGFRGGARSYFAFDDTNPNTRPEDRLERGFGHFEEHDGYLTDALANEACAIIERNTAAQTPFFLYLSFNAVHSPMDADADDLKNVDPSLSDKRRTLAAMTIALDKACGQVLQKLDDLGISDNTIVIFTNDNGGPTDSNASSNYPLSGTKANHLEGGIRVPCIMRWNHRIQAGSTYEHPVSTLDWLPTFLDAADASPIAGLDGVSLLPFIRGHKDVAPHDMLYWKKENRAAIRKGDFKLLRFPDRPAELYNIREDESEQYNLASQQPETVKELFKDLFAWELQLERPMWQLKREFEGAAAERMDTYRSQHRD